MSFETLRELKGVLVKFNMYTPSRKAEFHFPHMYADGKWAVTIIFDGVLDQSVLNLFSSALQNGKGSYFLGVVNDRITMHIQ